MKAKEYLQLIQKYKTLINIKIEKLEELKALSEKTTKILSLTGNVQTSRKNDNLENIIIEIEEKKEEITNDINKMLEIQAEVENKIFNLQNNNYCELLCKRYIYGLTWEQISFEMDYNPAWVHTLHNRALAEIQKELDKKL